MAKRLEVSSLKQNDNNEISCYVMAKRNQSKVMMARMGRPVDG
jgi:hypothetical protein